MYQGSVGELNSEARKLCQNRFDAGQIARIQWKKPEVPAMKRSQEFPERQRVRKSQAASVITG
jgi:hypothetical protein